MSISKHNVEQMARAYLMYELAKRGYNVQITDSRFPAYDMLVVSPNGKHFGIEVKGQSTKNFWRFTEREPKPDMFYAFVYVPYESINEIPNVFIMDSSATMNLWHEYKDKARERPVKNDKTYQWGINWKQPFPYKDRYDLLPK